ncbi:gluconate 2-dehydrogenase subunit 3 family protein [Massilia agilis]|uniref:Gluconate 2-dehydrogenase subunit 3 family protein n=1 Tax=Massilia agilis TaxID=1811226 RepID=A0ABT2D6H0_9BURK|nr:gluconate 2-dehydrogenase subunit 3 family protein [Massilia agilis]MCS0806908.1 gluconate 2-dehydrogenase subunit 3 family protein [Massilia agilis]
MEKLSRRSFFKAAGATAAAIAGKAHALPHDEAAHQHAPGQRAGATAAPATYTFFRLDEARFIEAACARLIPADANGPGAIEAGVPNYIDKQLGGAWGAGERLYRSGPWQQGLPGQGYQLPFTPAELFHNALRAINEDIRRRRGTTFDQLPGAEQDAYLQSLQTGQQSLNGVPAHTFFESLLGLTIEGFFSDPIYGGNKDMVAWKMIGFPGAYASFYDLVDQHGMLYTRAPMSIGEDARGMIMIEPVSPPAHAPSAEAPRTPTPARRKGGK